MVQKTNQFSKSIKSSKVSRNVTIQLVLISFSFIAFNLPYFISWSYFYIDVFNQNDQKEFKNNFFSYVQLTKVFQILNYCIKFYVLFGTVSKFRNFFK